MRLLLLLAIDIAIGTPLVSLCAPPLGSPAPLTGVLSGADLSGLRCVVLIGENADSLWDKTCGINGHEPCPDAPLKGWPLPLNASLVVVPSDAYAPFVAVFVVPEASISQVGDPAGGPVPASLAALAVASATATRTNGPGLLCTSPTPSASPSASSSLSPSASASASSSASAAATTTTRSNEHAATSGASSSAVLGIAVAVVVGAGLLLRV